MIAHINQCQPEDKEYLDSEIMINNTGSLAETPGLSRKSSFSSGSNADVASARAAEKYVRSTNAFIARTSKLEKKAIDLLVAPYVYTPNTLFSAVYHPKVLKRIQMLRLG